MTVFLLLTFAVLLASPWPPATGLWQGTVRGRIELTGAKIKSRHGKVDASGVVVWLEAPGALQARGGQSRQTLLQRGKRFIPHVLAVTLDTEVDFPNQDPFFHNVFSVYHGKRFDLGLYASGETRPVRFNRPGVSYIFCNIHPQMNAVVLTLETPHYAVSDQDGHFAIPGVPAGRYQLQLWHERATPEHLAAQARAVHVGAASFDLGVIRLSEEGYIPRPHQNKYGEHYSSDRNRPLYKKP
jgi:plastocyanin